MLSKCLYNCVNQLKKISTKDLLSLNRSIKFHSRFQSHTSKQASEEKKRNRSIAYYSTAAVILTGGLTYAAVPLYRLFCQVQKRKIKLSNFMSMTI